MQWKNCDKSKQDGSKKGKRGGGMLRTNSFKKQCQKRTRWIMPMEKQCGGQTEGYMETAKQWQRQPRMDHPKEQCGIQNWWHSRRKLWREGMEHANCVKNQDQHLVKGEKKNVEIHTHKNAVGKVYVLVSWLTCHLVRTSRRPGTVWQRNWKRRLTAFY